MRVWSGFSSITGHDTQAIEPSGCTRSRAEPVTAIRFVAFGGDPVLQPGEQIVAADRAHRRAALPSWACTGLVLLGATVVASWGRNQGRVTIFPLAALDQDQRHVIEAQAVRMPLPDGPPKVLWKAAR